MRSALATTVAAVLSLALLAPLAAAAPTEVRVRIEGKTETLFEGPISSDVHYVRAASDTKWRRCNGINVNVPQNKVPGVVPTSAAADAMRIIGQDFDGRWFNQYEDYFLKRWATDAENEAKNEHWGVLVNNVFTDVGGCQYPLGGGDEVLWVYDAFDGRERLALYPAGYTGGTEPLTATATLNQPFELEVGTWEGYNEGVPPASPVRTNNPYEGAEVAPVTTNGQGFQKVDTASLDTVVSGADGKASITFTTPGWHRIKATDVVAGIEVAVRSNRLDVCVPQPPASDCGPPPADDQVRTPPPPVPGEVDEKEGPGEGPGGEEPKGEDPPGGNPPSGGPSSGDGGGAGGAGGESKGGSSSSTAGPSVPSPGPIRLQRPRLDRDRLAQGLVGVSWKLLDPGAGVAKWTIASRTLGRKGGGWVTRASGRAGTAATVRLPAAAAYRLRLTVVDALGAGTTVPLGQVQVPA
ncbi:MAG TPA: hypothetical protein VFX85_11550 [Solirubrobacterales bacterium]|nr:hypothetical protein [Solirubrobacterales bacterium]